MTFVADTSAMIALLDRRDSHHAALLHLFHDTGSRWVLPWAILPEVDYLAASRLGAPTQAAFFDDLASAALVVDWGDETDLLRAQALARQHLELRLGLVDTVVMAIAERLRADAIVTLDLRHFGAVALKPQPNLLPRDLESTPKGRARQSKRA